MNLLEGEVFVLGCERGCAGVVAGDYVADGEGVVVGVSVAVAVAVTVAVSGIWRLAVLHSSRLLYVICWINLAGPRRLHADEM